MFGSADLPTLWGEVEAWRRRRDPAEAAHELAVAVRELHDPALGNLALAVMGDIGAEVAGSEVRQLATESATRGFALCWLVDDGLEHQRCLLDPDDPYPFVDVLAHRLVTAGPKGLCATLALAGNHDQQIAVNDFGVPHQPRPTTCSQLSARHPSKIVAKQHAGPASNDEAGLPDRRLPAGHPTFVASGERSHDGRSRPHREVLR